MGRWGMEEGEERRRERWVKMIVRKMMMMTVMSMVMFIIRVFNFRSNDYNDDIRKLYS